MKNLIGFTKKTVWIVSILFLFVQLFTSSIHASDPISTSSTFSHTIKESGYVETSVSFTVSSTERTVLTYYTITIPQSNIDPEIYSITENRKLEATKYNRTNSTDLLIDFENAVVTQDSDYKIRISYTYPYTDRNVLELVSKILDTDTKQVSITYPKDFGEYRWISDQIEDLKQSDNNYILKIAQPDSNSVRIIFNQGIVYEFNISKSFNNPTDSIIQNEILLPPDTQFQKIVIEQSDPLATQSIRDNNGNYILIYTIAPQEQIDVKIKGYILMDYHSNYESTLSAKLDNTNMYWSLEQKQIEDIEAYLDSKGDKDNISTKKKLEYIYKYVIEKLTPTTSSTSISGGIRRGCIDVLNNPEDSSAEDYADVLHTILSYYDIPSIYTIGYISDISSYQEDGMFHYWIQAYDSEKWIVLDPYLEDYSKVSLFDREQLDHISILQRKYDPLSPNLPYYSDSDISFKYVRDTTVIYEPSSNISISLEPYSILNKYVYGSINIENNGNTILTGAEFKDGVPDINNYIDKTTYASNQILLPHISRDINFHIPYKDLNEDIIFSSVDIKNGSLSVQSELVSTEYSILDSTGYNIVTKIISAVIFLLFLFIVYLFIDKVIYKQ